MAFGPKGFAAETVTENLNYSQCGCIFICFIAFLRQIIQLWRKKNGEPCAIGLVPGWAIQLSGNEFVDKQ